MIFFYLNWPLHLNRHNNSRTKWHCLHTHTHFICLPLSICIPKMPIVKKSIWICLEHKPLICIWMRVVQNNNHPTDEDFIVAARIYFAISIDLFKICALDLCETWKPKKVTVFVVVLFVWACYRWSFDTYTASNSIMMHKFGCETLTEFTCDFYL